MTEYDKYCERCNKVKLTDGLGNQIEGTTMWFDSDNEVLCGACYDVKHDVHRSKCPTCGQDRMIVRNDKEIRV